jgi:hypothetical protein
MLRQQHSRSHKNVGSHPTPIPENQFPKTDGERGCGSEKQGLAVEKKGLAIQAMGETIWSGKTQFDAMNNRSNGKSR